MFFERGSTQHPRSLITYLLTTYCVRHPIPAYLGLTGWLANNHQPLLSTYYTPVWGSSSGTVSFNLHNKASSRYY